MGALTVDILGQLGAVVGADQVVAWGATAERERQRLAGATSGVPAGWVFPETEAALAAVVKVCAEHGWRILTCGAGSKLSWGSLATGTEVVVSTARLGRIVDYWVEDFTVRVEAGLPLIRLQEKLRENRQFLALDPLFGTQATVGGIVATGDTGAWRQRYGGVRDALIGIQFVRADGEVVKAGGRVVKNVAGYDLMKLMTGSYGTLGILSQLTFRVFPQPEVSQTLVLTGSLAGIGAVALASRLAGVTPVAMDVVGRGSARSQPSFQVSLAARFQGIEEAVIEQIQRLQAVARDGGSEVTILRDDADEAFWQDLGKAFEIGDEAGWLCKIGIVPTAIPEFLHVAEQVLPSAWVARIHSSSGLGQLAVPFSAEVEGEVMTLRSHCESNQGFLTVLQAPYDAKLRLDVWGYPGNALGLMKQLKTHFDPAGLLNPGRYVGAI